MTNYGDFLKGEFDVMGGVAEVHTWKLATPKVRARGYSSMGISQKADGLFRYFDAMVRRLKP